MASTGGESTLLRTDDLVSRARAGDGTAREELLSRYRARLERLLHSRLPPAARGLLETQDLVQEVSIQALSSLKSFEYRGIGSYWAFLRKIALRCASRASERVGRRGHVEVLLEGSAVAPAAPSPSPLGKMIDRELLDAFESALERLPAKQREALLMRIELDLDYSVVAAECGFSSPDAARMSVTRALERISKEMLHERPEA